MPKLWNETVDAHRRAVRDATLDAAAALVAERGLASVTMSEIAERTGIGRATLYKYFPDVEAILLAWHERQVAGHLAHIAEIAARQGDPGQRLEAVLAAYAQISQRRHGGGLAAALHRGEHVATAEAQLRAFVRALLAECVKDGTIRTDVSPDELAGYCLSALAAAAGLQSKAAIHRLVCVILAGLRPPP
jgi:AcrR family transcriptional regulator